MSNNRSAQAHGAVAVTKRQAKKIIKVGSSRCNTWLRAESIMRRRERRATRWLSTPVSGKTMAEVLAAMPPLHVMKHIWMPGMADVPNAEIDPLDDIERARQKREGLAGLPAEWAAAIAACRAVARAHGASFSAGPPMSIAELKRP